ncbi:MAG TPA: hypothetical protein VHO90_02970, partial [Bacteroidales bacterium]|nr:hypothetical protein [Bacteroidales bacterium]
SMQYISPFRLLGLDITEISQNPNSVNVSFLKKKLLAEFELSNTVTIETEAGELSKNDVLGILDQLQSSEILNYHVQIAGDPMLLDFLQYNALEGVFEKNPIYTDDGFLKFIAPYFAHAYCMLVTYILDNEEASNSFLYRIPLLIPTGEELKRLQPIRKKTYDIIAGIEHYTEEFAKSETGKIPVDRKLFGFNIIRTLNALDYSVFEHDIEAYATAVLKMLNESIDVKRSTFRDNELAYDVLKRIENLKLGTDTSKEVKRFLAAFRRTPEEKVKGSGSGIGSILYAIIFVVFLIRTILTCDSSSTSTSNSMKELFPSADDTLNDNDSIRYRRVFNYLEIGQVGYGLRREGGRFPEYISLKTGDNPYKTLPSLDIDTTGKKNSLKFINNSNLNVVGAINSVIGNAFVYVSSKDSIVIGTNAEAVNIFFAAGKRWDKACKIPRVIYPGKLTYAKDVYGLFSEPAANFFSLANIINVQFLPKNDKKKKPLLFTPTFLFYNNGDSVKVDSFIPQQENEEEQIRENSREDSDYKR